MAENLFPDASRQKQEHIEQLLGRLLVEINSLDASVSQCIGALLDVEPETTLLIVRPMSLRHKLRVVEALGEKRLTDSNAKNRLKQLVSEARALNDERNAYVHSEYETVYDEGFNIAGFVRARHGAIAEILVESETLRVLVERISKCNRGFYHFGVLMWDWHVDDEYLG